MGDPIPLVSTFDLLDLCIKHLGAAVFPLWGVTVNGDCLCPRSAVCTEAKQAGKHPYGKLAPNGFLSASRDRAVVRQWTRSAAKVNWGLRTGEPLPGGGFLGVLDVDPRNGSELSLAEIIAREGPLPETVCAATGGGGQHYFFRFPHAPASRCPGPGLDLQGVNKYVAIAPSRHYLRGVYSWELGQGPGDIAVADAPRWLIEGTEEGLDRPVRDTEDSARHTVLGEAFSLAGRAGPIMPDGTMYVNCVQSHLHSDARGRGEDDSTVILPPAGGSRFGGYSCRHGHCANLKWQQVMDMLPKAAAEAGKQKYPMIGVVPPAPEGEPASAAPLVTVPAGVDQELQKFRTKLHFKTNAKGGFKIINDIINLNIILSHDPRWKGVLRYDEFAQVLRFAKTPEWHPDDTPKDPSEVWQDVHVTCLDLWLRRNWSLELPSEKIREGVYVVGRRNGFNPLVEYMDSLQWDGEHRLEKWLTNYLGCLDNDYNRAVGRKWILSGVARAYQPGCQAHHVLILEGRQGIGKSRALGAISPHRAWFSDTPFDLGNKDAYMALRGKFIIELAELASLKRADIDKVKSFFTSPVDSFRPPFGRERVDVPRTCIFAGSVNLGQYLADETGARRFWPVRCGVIDNVALEADRDQIWAEAVSIYKSWVSRGSPQSECLWWPSQSEADMFEVQQAEREVANPWTEAIATWLQSPRAKALLQARGCLLVREIAQGALALEDKDLNPTVTNSIGVVMLRDLKWFKSRANVAGARVWGYRPVDKPQ